jgi:peptide/nickel transport system substrate-binding protein
VSAPGPSGRLAGRVARSGRSTRERMRWLVVALAAVMVVAVVGTAPASKDTLVIGMPTDVPIFDTHKATGLHNGSILNQVSEPLVRLTTEGKIVPWLVESWEQSKDGKTWTLHTRKGIKFTDGTPFNAEALRFNLERFRRLSIGKATLAMVKTMEVAGEHDLKITTEAPFAPFINSLGYHWIVVYSPTQIQKVGDDNLHTAPVGTGPFKFVHHKRGQEVRLEANDQYWGGKPKLRAIVSRPYPDQGARMLALESGDVDLIFHVPPQEAARLAKISALAVSTPPSARVIWIYLNTQRDPFKDKRVRQAIYLAIDREAIVKNIFAGTAKALHSPGPVGSYGYTDKYDTLGYNPERAKQLLKDAGLSNVSFTLHHSPGRYLLSGQVVEAIQGYLKQVGVTMRVTDLEWGALSQLTAQPVEKNQTQAVLFGWRSVNGDIDSAIQDFGSAFWRPKGNNGSFWKSEEYDRLLTFEQGTLDGKKRLEALHRMQEILMDEMPALWLYGEPQIWAAKRTLKGVEWNPLESIQSLHAAYFED